MTQRKRTTGGPKTKAPAAKKTAKPRVTKAQKDAALESLRNFIAAAPIDAMLAVSVENIRADIYEAHWNEDGHRKAFRGSFHSVYLWIAACIAEGQLLTGITASALEKLYAARRVFEARKAA